MKRKEKMLTIRFVKFKSTLKEVSLFEDRPNLYERTLKKNLEKQKQKTIKQIKNRRKK